MKLVKVDADCFCSGPVVLMMDSGGGREGMHLSLEFALLMSRSDIHVFALREYFTKALMPLDREPHKQMQVGWSHLKSRFAAEHGHSVSNQFQALALIREAWAAGTQAKHILTGWRQTGIVPWCPDELLVEQAPSLFRSQHQAVKDHKFMDRASKDSETYIPPPLQFLPGKKRVFFCANCSQAIPNSLTHLDNLVKRIQSLTHD